MSDTGIGMTLDIQARIFEPFFTTKGRGHGTGLGLATVYGIVQENGGFVTVSSEVGVGSRFTICLPAFEDAAPTESTPDAADLSSLRGRETILLVEDEHAVRQVARLTLEMQGYWVIEASSGRQAIENAGVHKGQIDLVLTDLVMPEMSGRQLVDELRRRGLASRVLFMSGYDKESVGRRAEGASAVDDILQKPFTPLGLAARVRHVLDGAA